MSKLIKDEIHTQSHVPDLASAKELAGIAVQRMMFDFENVVSSAEAEFDTGLLERIRMILTVLRLMSRADGTFDEITISHKRNEPVNLMEFADISLKMSQTGLSMESIIEIWPDDIYPSVEQEMERQEKAKGEMIPDVEAVAQKPIQDEEQIMDEGDDDVNT
jgi:SPP1 family phage portal protein